MKTIFSVHGSRAVCYFLIGIKALPTPLAMSILHAANKLRNTFKRTIASQALLALFRASLPECVKIAFFCRFETGVRCQTGDLAVDRSSGHICLYIRKSKETSGATR
jgi:hypothetical protein